MVAARIFLVGYITPAKADLPASVRRGVFFSASGILHGGRRENCRLAFHFGDTSSNELWIVSLFLSDLDRDWMNYLWIRLLVWVSAVKRK
jgi:hypothetical protein